jgi:heavy metal translocating P-type ATPase
VARRERPRDGGVLPVGPPAGHGGWSAWRPAARAHRESLIAAIAVGGIAAHLVLRWAFDVSPLVRDVPLYLVLAAGGGPLVLSLATKALRREFGSDLLAGISIVTAILLGEYLAGALVVLMLSGGEALEQLAVGRASAVLQALASRMPAVAHRQSNGNVVDVQLDDIAAGEHVVVFPHEICPVDGIVVDGHGVMDESYLTGEPFMMMKAPGSEVFSGAINGENALTLRATRRAVDSRYARIMRVMEESEQRRPQLRRLGDQLGAWYTPLALAIGIGAWAWSGDAVRFLAVLVVATPCPLLIAIPVAIIGSISLAARHGIIIRDPAILERIDTCRTIILDKTGTLTYGEPALTERFVADGLDDQGVLQLAASLERYSRHPLAEPILQAARREGLALLEAAEISEHPGEGLRGVVGGTRVRIIGRKQAVPLGFGHLLPEQASGLECVVLVDEAYAAAYRFHDAPREDSRSFISHLGPRHQLERILLVSGDREQEVRYLADRVGITEVYGGCSPEQKVEITRAETARAPTLFIGDGINDAPALAAATVGIAFGNQSEITAEAAGAVVMDTSLQRVDQLFHISRRMRRVALQSAVGGMAVSVAGMAVAFAGYLPPVSGAVVQEVIDLVAVLNALRAGVAPGPLTDYQAPGSPDNV